MGNNPYTDDMPTIPTFRAVVESPAYNLRNLVVACDRRYSIQARFVCTVCKNKMWGPPSVLVAMHPEVIAFYVERGTKLGYTSTDFVGVLRLQTLIREHDQAALVSTEPVRIQVTFRCEDDELRLTLDETLTALAVDTNE